MRFSTYEQQRLGNTDRSQTEFERTTDIYLLAAALKYLSVNSELPVQPMHPPTCMYIVHIQEIGRSIVSPRHRHRDSRLAEILTNVYVYCDWATFCSRPLDSKHWLPWLDGLRNALTCDTANISSQIMQDEFVRLPGHSSSFAGYRNCIKEHNHTYCAPLLQAECKSKDLRAAKTIRLPMYVVEEILPVLPNLKVIYYTRDPRGVINSKSKISGKGTATKGAQNLCLCLEEDHRIFTKLQRAFPARIAHVTYENLAAHPQETAERIYEFIGHTIPQSVVTWLDQNTREKGQHPNPYGTKRNSTARKAAWKTELDADELRMIESVCKDALDKLGYIL